MKHIYPFNHTPIPPITQVGGKAHSLIIMTNAEFTVPNGFVCGADFFASWNEKIQASTAWSNLQNAIEKDEDIATYINKVKEIIKTFTLSETQENSISEALQGLSADAQYAVRSSSPEEDLEGSSFAGIYETVLGVPKDNIKNAVLQVFLSAFEERVFVYKKAKGFLVDQVKIAVVIMEQIDSATAGVGFSVNPINNDYDEVAINANFGLGESVVGGVVTPDYFVVNKVDSAVITKTLGNKKKSFHLSGNSGGTHEKDNADSSSFCITDNQATEITEMIVKVEKLYGLPVDIEWAYANNKLYMIQARPITTHIPIPEAMQTEPGAKKRTLYYDCSVIEGITTNKPITPMTLDWTLNTLGTAMVGPYAGDMSFSADGNPETDIFFGKGVRLYMNWSQLFFLSSPKSLAKPFEDIDKDAYEALLNIDEKIYLPTKKFPYLKWRTIAPFVLRSLVRSHKAIWEWIEESLNPIKFYETKYKPCADETLDKLNDLDKFEGELDEYLKLTEVILAKFTELFMPTMLHYAKEMAAIQDLFKDDTPDNKDLADHLTMGIQGDEAIGLGIDLYNLSRLLSPSAFDNITELSKKCHNRELPQDFMTAWDNFIAKHGMRGPNEMEIANPSYSDDFSLAFQQMSTMLHATESPEKSLDNHVKQRDAAYKKLMQELPDKKAKKLKHHFELARTLAPSRDTLKYVFVKMNQKTRKLALRDAQVLVKDGKLGEINDIFFATFQEMSELKKGNDGVRALVEKRKDEFKHASANIQSFPMFIDSRGRIPASPTNERKHSDDNDPNVLYGSGISRGIARGRVKVLKDPREKKIEQGDILVTYNTDPGWTPLFIGAEGIVLEIGAVLQHGGLVAREYAKPCVAGIHGITEKLKDGQMVEVNGTEGTVKIL